VKPKKQICNEKLRQKSKGKPEVKGRAFEISYYAANFTVQFRYLRTGYAFEEPQSSKFITTGIT
jgi:hypothetical protein